MITWVLGRSGVGKTAYLRQQIPALAKYRQVLYLVPEQGSLALEQELGNTAVKVVYAVFVKRKLYCFAVDFIVIARAVGGSAHASAEIAGVGEIFGFAVKACGNRNTEGGDVLHNCAQGENRHRQIFIFNYSKLKMGMQGMLCALSLFCTEIYII